MKPYSSLVAFIEHYRTLKSRAGLSAQEQLLLAEMEKLIDSIGVDVRTVVDGTGEESTAASHRRERAERTMARELRSRGLLPP